MTNAVKVYKCTLGMFFHFIFFFQINFCRISFVCIFEGYKCSKCGTDYNHEQNADYGSKSEEKCESVFKCMKRIWSLIIFFNIELNVIWDIITYFTVEKKSLMLCIQTFHVVDLRIHITVCPRIFDSFHIVGFYIKLISTSCSYCTHF